MKLRAGERPNTDKDIRCSRCGRKAHVDAGQRVQQCTCGGTEFRDSEEEEEEEH
jgi:ribosomal protein L37E